MPGKNDINPITGQPYAVNPATGSWDDNYWATQVEPMLKKQFGNPVLDYLNSVADETSKRMDEYNKKIKDFDSANPYAPDEWLADEKAQAEQRLDPYYTQTLNDYLQGVTTRRSRSLEDERTVLKELQADEDQYTGRAKIALDNALEKSREGYADSGLYNSGASLRTEGRLTEESQSDTGDFLRRADESRGRVQTGTARTLEDLDIGERTYRRDLNQEKSYNVESSAQSGLSNRLGQYAFERNVATGPGIANPQQFDNFTYGLLR